MRQDVGLEARIAQVDRHVGARLRQRRVALGLSLSQAAELVGITYHQQFKYETGVNRVAAGRLFVLAVALNVSVDWFFEGAEFDVRVSVGAAYGRRLLDLMRHLDALPDDQCRALLGMAEALAIRSAGALLPRDSEHRAA